MKAWRNSRIAAETFLVFVVLTSGCAAIIALNRTPVDDRYLNILNAGIATVLIGFVVYRYLLRLSEGVVRTGWIIAGLALGLFAVTQLSEGPRDAVEPTLDLEDMVGIALLLVLPASILAAGRAERIGRNAMLLVAAAAAAQIASTGIDLLDDLLARIDALGPHATEVLTNVSEFIFLQLYLIGLALAPMPKLDLLRTSKTFKRLSGMGFTPKRIYSWHVEPAWWALRNLGGAPEDYYADRIRRRIHDGRFHPAIGQRARSVRAPSELLDILLAHGLQPSHTVVDYGCGSFRLGEPLIEYLEPGRYWGLDVVEDFLTMGMRQLDPDLVSAKRPNAFVINDAGLAHARAAVPDFIVSWHVCSKVPPRRLSDYFGKIVSLMGPTTLALVHFPETERRRRQSRFSWAQSRGVIEEVLGSIDPSLEIRFAPVTSNVARGVRQTMVMVRRHHSSGSPERLSGQPAS